MSDLMTLLNWCAEHWLFSFMAALLLVELVGAILGRG
jgi:hypothetical protein